jgi:phage replication initiation protein
LSIVTDIPVVQQQPEALVLGRCGSSGAEAHDEQGAQADTPPASNTGALNTQVKIDWLECTFQHSQLDTLQEWCRRFDFEELDHGAMGYDCAAKFAGSGWLLWCSTDERGERQGVHVSFPSTCLDTLLAHGYNSTQLLNTIDLFGAKVTRIDIAYDDHPQDAQAGLLDLDTILDAVKADKYVSRARTVRLMQTLKGGKGTTLYFGTGQSDSLLRIYDKAAEQKLDDEHWIRVEIQLRRERAHALFLLLANEYSVEDFDMGAVLLAVLDFKTPTDDENKSRWPTVSWWAEFVNTVSRIRLSKARVIADSIEKSKRWIHHQVAPTLAFLMKANQGDMDYLTGVLIEGLQRLSKAKQAILKAVLAGQSDDAAGV